MTPREFFNAWLGYQDGKTEDMEATRAIIYGASRFNAASTAMSKEQATSIGRHRFPWEKSSGAKSRKEINNLLAGL